MARWPLHELPLRRWRPVVVAAVVAIGLGALLDAVVPTAADRLFHDAAIAARPRRAWPHVGLVVLDPGVPADVSRLQLLPLYARAARAALAAGARAVYLDAHVLAFPDRRIPYAQFIDRAAPQAPVKWFKVECAGAGEPDLSLESPLLLRPAESDRFLIAPPLVAEGTGEGGVCTPESKPARYPLEVLFGARAARRVTVGCPDLPSPSDEPADGVQRWFAVLPRQVPVLLAARLGANPAAVTGGERCHVAGGDATVECRRVRFSVPTVRLATGDRPMLALSALADCDAERGKAAAAPLAGRVVVMQMSGLDERADTHVTPMTVGAFGPKRFTPGSQYIADAVETLIAVDHPRRPGRPLRLGLLALVGVLGVLAGARLRASAALAVPVLAVAGAFALCFATPPVVRLWPVVAPGLVALLGVGVMLGLHLVLGTRQGQLTARYLPRPVRTMLTELGGPGKFQQRQVFATVLMSDVRGYSTVTGILKTPAAILNLLNDYLEVTTSSLQDDHGAWFESYVGDLACFYWPAVGRDDPAATMRKALGAAVHLSRLQQRYFAELETRTIAGTTPETLRAAGKVIGAGVGLAAGDTVMGNLGPPAGVQRFGLLGDVLNLSSRLESLSRLFDTEIVVTAELAEVARAAGLCTRRLGRLKVKGRILPAEVYAVGEATDERFAAERIAAWEAWLCATEAGEEPAGEEPGYAHDAGTIRGWVRKGLLDRAARTFVLDEK